MSDDTSAVLLCSSRGSNLNEDNALVTGAIFLVVLIRESAAVYNQMSLDSGGMLLIRKAYPKLIVLRFNGDGILFVQNPGRDIQGSGHCGWRWKIPNTIVFSVGDESVIAVDPSSWHSRKQPEKEPFD